jgi:universal stress protein F
MYKTILVPVDLSHKVHCTKTLALAREIGGSQCRIVALYVAPDIPGYVATHLPSGVLHDSLAHAKVEIKELADQVGAETVVLSGHAPTQIIGHADNIKADLIVIASHRPGVQDYFLGSTAARVVRHAECAVLVDR